MCVNSSRNNPVSLVSNVLRRNLEHTYIMRVNSSRFNPVSLVSNLFRRNLEHTYILCVNSYRTNPVSLVSNVFRRKEFCIILPIFKIYPRLKPFIIDIQLMESIITRQNQ